MIALLLIAGFILLIAGAEYLVRGSVAVAKAFGMSQLLIGLTILAFGTSAPELGISVLSAFKGEVDLALGNVVGSNIINLLFVMGLAGIIIDLEIHGKLLKRDIPIMIAAAALLFLFCIDLYLERWEGSAMFGLLLVYLAYSYRSERQVHLKDSQEKPTPLRWQDGLNLMGGAIGLALGCHFFVKGASLLALKLGIPSIVVGLTVVALGTSLPELVTTVVAAFRGQRDMAVGNVVGSNIFNVLTVMGITAAVSPQTINVPKSILAFDFPFMLLISFACFPLLLLGYRFTRSDGILFVSLYVIYTLSLFGKSYNREYFSNVELLLATAVFLLGRFLYKLWVKKPTQ